MNQIQVQLLTPEPSATDSVAQSPATCNAHVNAKRHRNPAVAQYLGLESCNERPQPEDFVTVDQGSPAFSAVNTGFRKKSIKGKSISETARTSQHRLKDVKKRRRTEGRCVQPDSDLIAGPKAVIQEASWLDHIYPPAVKLVSQVLGHESEKPTWGNTVSEGQVRSGHQSHSGNPQHSGNYANNDANELDWTEPPELGNSTMTLEDGILNEDLDDADFFNLPLEIFDADDEVYGTRSSTVKSNSSGEAIDHDEDLFDCNRDTTSLNRNSSTKQRISKAFISPVTRTTQLLVAKGNLHSAEARKPIVRSAFPPIVNDRSPIIGLSSSAILRTCFRIGEAISQAHQASKSGRNAVIELYARILDSERGNDQQSFTFCDIFHARQPFVKATFQCKIWKPVQLFSYDSQRLLQPGRICRCIGKLDRLENEWVMRVMNVWEATWEDIKWVEGVIDS